MASANVSFDTLPSSIRKPGTYNELNTKLAVRNLPANAQKVVIIAAKTAEGGLAVNTPTDIYSDFEARAYAGSGSTAHKMALAAMRAYPYVRLSLVVVEDDAASVAASASVTITGTAEGSGVISVTIAGKAYRIAATRGDAPTAMAAALADAVNAVPECPVKATAAAGALTLTARNKGALGNGIALEASATTKAVTVTVAAFSGGETNPDVTPALTSIFAAGHNIIISPYTDTDNMTALREHLQNTGHALEQRGAIGVAAMTSTLSQATTLAASLNEGRISIALLPGTASMACEVAAAYGAVMASEEDPARPLNNLDLVGIAIPPVTRRLGRVEQETALANGVTPLQVGPGDTVQIVRAISTYTKNDAGADDVSLLDITTMRTFDYVSKACRERIDLRFPREKLSAKTPMRVRSELIDVLLKLEDLEIVEEVAANLPYLVVERDAQDANRLNAAIPVDIVNGLHIRANRIDLLL